jgi:hypothetical protein
MEAGRFYAHFICAGCQGRHTVLTALIAEQDAFERRGHALHFDGSVGHNASGRIVNSTGDFTSGRLGRQGGGKYRKKQHPQKALHLNIQTQWESDSKRQ